MKTGQSEFLEEKRPLLKKLIHNLETNYSYVSILGTDVTGKQYKVMSTGVTINDSMWSERGFVLRLHDGIGYFEFSFNRIEEGFVETIAEEVRKRASLFREQMSALGAESVSALLLDEQEKTLNYDDEVAILPDAYTPGEIVEKLTAFKDKAHSLSDEVFNVMSMIETVQVRKLFLSAKKELSQSYIWSQGYLFILARRNGKTKYSIKGFSGLKGLEILDEMDG
ncbi:MAG: TldD/PmbA family protein, partial [Thermotogota bacterium]